MNTGLPRQVTVTLLPSAIGARLTSVEASARTSAEGFMVSISGQATQAAPTTPIRVAARYKKSRRVSPESAGAEVAISAMRPFPLRSHFRRLGGQGPTVRTRDLAPARRPPPYPETGTASGWAKSCQDG